MRRGMNLVIRDESDEERKGEGQVDQEEQEEEFLHLEEEKRFKPLPRLEKDLSSMFLHF